MTVVSVTVFIPNLLPHNAGNTDYGNSVICFTEKNGELPHIIKQPTPIIWKNGQNISKYWKVLFKNKTRKHKQKKY